MLGAESVRGRPERPCPGHADAGRPAGYGKTTTAAKLAKRFAERLKRKVLMASLDTRRPAAQEQLGFRRAGRRGDLPIVAGQTPVEIAARAMTAALGGYDVVLLDTAGRTHIDEPLMLEMAADRTRHQPARDFAGRRLLTGQDAVNVARSFSSASASPALC